MAYLKALSTFGGEYIYDLAFVNNTRMMFQQASAPTGWTRDETVNDTALRVVNGISGAATNAGVKNFSTVFNAAVEVTGTISDEVVTGSYDATESASISLSHNLAISSHALSITEIPYHRHGISEGSHRHTYSKWRPGGSGQDGGDDAGGDFVTGYSSYAGTGVTVTAYNGSGGAHTHGLTGSVTATDHFHQGGDFTSDVHNHVFAGNDLNLTVKYCDVIIATKD